MSFIDFLLWCVRASLLLSFLIPFHSYLNMTPLSWYITISVHLLISLVAFISWSINFRQHVLITFFLWGYSHLYPTLYTLVSCGRLCWEITTLTQQQKNLSDSGLFLTRVTGHALLLLSSLFWEPGIRAHLRPAILTRERTEQWQNLTMPLKMSAQAQPVSLPLTQLARVSHMAKPDNVGQGRK